MNSDNADNTFEGGVYEVVLPYTSLLSVESVHCFCSLQEANGV